MLNLAIFKWMEQTCLMVRQLLVVSGEGGTMTVTIHSGATGIVSIICQTGTHVLLHDCRARGTDTCNLISFLCNGTCLIPIYSPTTTSSSVPSSFPTSIATTSSTMTDENGDNELETIVYVPQIWPGHDNDNISNYNYL